MNINFVTINFSKKQLQAFQLFLNEENEFKFLHAYDEYLEFVKSDLFSKSGLIFINIDESSEIIFSELENFPFRKGVIFTSNDKIYAYNALKMGAIDFLLNPIDQAEFKKTTAKIKSFKKSKKIKKHTKGDFIYVKSNLKNIKVYINSIKWIQALGDYVKVFCEDNTYIVLSTMKVFENKLSSYSFLRIHKSYIVNLKKIEKLTTKQVTIAGEDIPLSRNKKPHLYKVLKIE